MNANARVTFLGTSRSRPLVTLLAASLLAAAAFAPLASAQAPTKAAAPAAPAPAPAAPISVEQRAAIRELIDVMHTREGVAALLQGISQNLRPQLGQMMKQRIEANQALTVDQKQQVAASMQQPFENAVIEAQKIISDPKVVDDIVDRLTAIYARTFTLDELKQLNAFYKTPLGLKSLTAVPSAAREAMQGMMGTVGPKLDALAESTVQKQVDLVTKSAAPAKAAPAKK
jgi:hypothetical protein